jgi:DNA-binding NarL/FixJ family response regulator
VLALIVEGRTNREIGEALFISTKTASTHVSHILFKLDVRSRIEAATAAHRLGLVPPASPDRIGSQAVLGDRADP